MYHVPRHVPFRPAAHPHAHGTLPCPPSVLQEDLTPYERRQREMQRRRDMLRQA